MREVVRIEKDISEAIDLFLEESIVKLKEVGKSKEFLITEHYKRDWESHEMGKYAALNKISTEKLMDCLVNGYKPTEDKSSEENNKTGVKFVKTWTEVITDSFAGKDNGHLKLNHRVYSSIKEMFEDHNKYPNEKYYKFESVDDEIKDLALKDAKKEFELEQNKKRRRLEFEIKKKQEELDFLNMDMEG